MELNEMIVVGIGVVIITLIGVGIAFASAYFFKNHFNDLKEALKQ